MIENKKIEPGVNDIWIWKCSLHGNSGVSVSRRVDETAFAWGEAQFHHAYHV